MFSLRKASAGLIAAALVLLASPIPVCAGGGVGRNKVAVPASMVKGSALPTGRAFYRSGLPEDSLAGIRLGRPAKEILARWGNPTRITVGSAEGAVTTGAPPLAGPAYTPPGANPYESLTRGLGTAARMYGGETSPLGALPPLPGLSGPEGEIPSYGPTAPIGQTRVLSQEEVTWTYDLQNGITLEFIITDGTITQITSGGIGPWSGSKVRTGLQLGDTYKLILWVAGYPESQKYSGRFLRVSYVNKSRVLFTLLNRKVVGITIALVPQELK